MNLLRSGELASCPDPNTDPRLLPGFMRQEEDGRRALCYRTALRMAMDSVLTPSQREVLHMRFWLGMSVAQIGKRLGLSPSGTSKRVAVALDVLRRYVGFCVEVDSALQREEG